MAVSDPPRLGARGAARSRVNAPDKGCSDTSHLDQDELLCYRAQKFNSCAVTFSRVIEVVTAILLTVLACVAT